MDYNEKNNKKNTKPRENLDGSQTAFGLLEKVRVSCR